MTSAATGSREARPDPRRIWAYRGYRDKSRFAAESHALVVVGPDGTRHELPLGEAAHDTSAPAHVLFTTTSHVGARGSVWREPRIVVADHGGRALLTMRADGYRAEDVKAVAAQAGLSFSERWFDTAAERDAAVPIAPGAVQLDVASRSFKLGLVVALVLVTFVVLAAVVVLVESL